MNLGLNALRRSYVQLRSDLKKAKGTLTLAAGIRNFLREPITVPQAKEELKEILDRREENFLALTRTQIFERPGSPYLKLLQHAGCEFSDLRTLVLHHGLAKTLEHLAKGGVYLTSDEFKGKKEVVRGGLSFRVSPKDFEPSYKASGFVIQSSGTRNRPVRYTISLEWLNLRTLAMAVYFSAHNLFSHTHAMYDAILPGAGGVNNLLCYAKLGICTDRWFARKIPVNHWLDGQYHYLMTYLIVMMGKWFGPGFPKPEFIDVKDLERIVRWVLEKKRQGKTCCIGSAASNAARIARVAWEIGESLEGVKFNVSGEPLTEAKREVMERVGATVTVRFAVSAGINVGYGCANPAHVDELHVNQHMLEVIRHPNPLADDGSAIHPLLATTIHPSAMTLLLNVDNGDYATVERRDCGCDLEKAGLTLHLHHIRSYEKFTSEGMNYFYGDLFELFEKILPAEFGGGPGDYQLVEEEDTQGQTRLSLIVHPAVGELHEEKILSRLRGALAQGSRGNRFMTNLWQDAGTFRVVRKVPHSSGRGKILPLHMKH